MCNYIKLSHFSPFLCMFIHMYACVCVRIRVHVCPSGVQMMTLVIIPWVSPTFSYATKPPNGMFLTNEEFWMISEPQRSTCSCLLGARITNVVSDMILHVSQGIKFKSSCLQDRHFQKKKLHVTVNLAIQLLLSCRFSSYYIMYNLTHKSD